MGFIRSFLFTPIKTFELVKKYFAKEIYHIIIKWLMSVHHIGDFYYFFFFMFEIYTMLHVHIAERLNIDPDK